MESCTLGRLVSCTFEEALLLRNRGFEEYFSSQTQTMQGLLSGFGHNGIRPEHSVVAYCDGKPVGFVFLAIKQVGNRRVAWNGGTGVIPEYRGRGIAKAMMKETERILDEQRVELALLEVVTKNTPAITAYEKGGFQIVDRTTGMSRMDAWESNPFHISVDEGWQIKPVKPREVGLLPFYRHLSAWECQWHSIEGGDALLLFDPEGEIAGYALYRRNYNGKGDLTSIYLYQCEAAPGRTDRDTIQRQLLSDIFGPFDLAVKRTAANFSKSNGNVVDLLKAAGFEERYEQYLMARMKSSDAETGQNV